jgi:hypothetical protein
MTFSTNSSPDLLTAMMYQAAMTKSPTSQSLTAEQRDRLVDLVAERYLDSMDDRDLERFFLDIQTDYLNEYTDEELLGAVEDVFQNDNIEEILNELG